MKLNPITLEFPDELESDFLQYYYEIALKHGRIGLLTVIFLFFCFGILDHLIAPDAAKMTLWFIRYALVCPFLLITFFFTFSRFFQKHFQLIWSLTILVPGLSLLAISVVSNLHSSNPIHTEGHIAMILTLMYAYTFVILRFVYGVVISSILIIVYNLVGFGMIHIPVIVLCKNNFYLLAANFIGMFASYQIELYIRRTFFQTYLWRLEREKSERLLMNILPETIAKRLKEGSDIIADSFAEVTVLFADIVNFTSFSTRMSPIELVRLLNQIFSAFDELADKYGLEKIKTIGDAYMVVGGLPEQRPDHASAVANMALEMQETISRFNQATGEPFEMRIGIHSGPVIAGVIGIKKFIYDLWGDTVNMASRMESHGVPGCIQVSAETYQCLHSQYRLEERGVIEIKGKGKMLTYFLRGKLSPSATLEDHHHSSFHAQN